MAQELIIIHTYAHRLCLICNLFQQTTVDEDDDDDDDLDDKSKKKRGRSGKKSSSNSGSKKSAPVATTKVPTLKIKLGKRKQATSVS